MTISRSELLQYKSVVVDETLNNGGGISAVPVVSGVLNNVFPNVSKAQRLSGLTTYRKVFIKNTNLVSALIAPIAWIDTITAGDDYIVMFAGDATDIVDDLVSAARKYGCSSLKTNATAGATSFVVSVEHADLASGNDQIIKNGDTIRITNKSDIDSGVGTEEEFTITALTTNYLGNAKDMLISISPSVLANTYTVVGNTRVMSIYSHVSDLFASSSVDGVTSAAGTYNNTDYPVVVNNIGTVDDTITIHFTSATAFTVTSDVFGSLTAGSRSADYTFNNPNYPTSLHFQIPTLAWGGTFVNGDEVVFLTNSASMAIWRKRVVPANSNSLNGNKTVLVFGGESE